MSGWVTGSGLLPLQDGTWRQNGFVHRMEPRGDTWRCYPDPHGTVSSFDFSTRPRRLRDFATHCRTLSTAPDSSFVRALTVQRPQADALSRLRARTLSFRGPEITDGGTSRLLNREEFTAALRELFGLSRLDDAVITALWAKASAQHEAWLKRQGATG